MLYFSSLYLIWFAGLLLHAGAVIKIFHLKLQRYYFLFTLYSIFVVLKSSFNFYFSFYFIYPFYYYAYWYTEAVTVFLSLLVIHEIVSRTFQDYEGIRSLGTRLFFFVVIVLMFVGIVTVLSQQVAPFYWMTAIVLRVRLIVNIMQTGMTMFLIIFTSAFCIQWKKMSFGIALGVGLNACFMLTNDVIATQLGTSGQFIFGWMMNFIFALVQLIWCVTVFLPARDSSPIEAQPVRPLEQWNQALVELMQR